MTTDFSLMDAMGNFTGFPVSPDMSQDNVSTATTAPVVTPAVEGKKPVYINPKFALKTEPVAPVADQAAYNAGIQQAESGGRTDIGYHNRQLSSAYGPYGMTSAAYEDARKRNPNLPADITQASPEQLTQAQNAFTQANAGYLQNYGIPVNPNTLSAAHLLGAKGLKDYQDTGYISPAAAKANGGEANLRNIVEARLGGTMAPASGAVNPEQPVVTTTATTETTVQPPIEAYTGGGLKTPGGQTQAQLQQEQGYHSILNSNSQQEIGKLAFDMNTPKEIQRAALDKLSSSMAVEDGMRRAQAIAAKVQENPTPQAINRAMNDKDTGSYFKVLLYQALGWTSKAKQELNKIDPEVTYTGVTMPDGQNYNVKYNKDTGQVMTAWDSQGEMITDTAKLGEIAAGGVNPATAKSFLMPQTSGSPVTKTINGQLVNGIQIYDPVRKSFYVQYGNQRDMNPQGWTSATQNADQQAMLKKQSAQIDLWKKFQNASTEAKFKYIEETNKALVGQFGANASLITPAEMGLQAPGLPPAAGGQPQVVQPPAAGGQPQVVQLPAAAVPPGAPAAAGPAPATVAGRPTLQQIQQQQAEQKAGLEVTTKEQEAFVKPKSEINANSRVGRETADITRTQINDLLNTPEMIGYLTAGPGTTYGQVGKFIREVITGSYDSDESGKKLADKMRELSIPTALQSKIQAYQQQNVRINALTLKSNEGPGAISNFENKQNQAANMSNIGDLTPYSALTGLGKRQFVGDITAAKQQYLAAHPELKTETAFENAWSKEQDRLMKGYQGIYQARLDAIKPYYDEAMKNPNDERAQQAYRDAAIASFKTYPTPDYNPQTGKWEYKTKQAKLAVMNALAGGQ